MMNDRRACWGVVALTAVSLAVLGPMGEHARGLLCNTLLLSTATCAFSLTPGIALAWVLLRTDMPGRRAGLWLLACMLFVPLYLQAAAWQAGFGLQGWWTLVLGRPVWLEGWAGAVLVHAVTAIPWVVLIVGSGFWLVEPELEEQALLDASPLRVFMHVTLPAAMPAVGIAALWIAIVTAGEMTVTDLFGVRTYAEELYSNSALGMTPVEASLGVMPGLLLTGWLVIGGMFLLKMLTPDVRPSSFAGRPVYRLGRWKPVATAVVTLALLLLIAIPLGNLVYKAGILVTQTEAGRIRQWSPVKCMEMIGTSPVRYPKEFGWSLLLGGLAAVGATSAAIGLAWTARRGGPRGLAVLLIVAVCLAVPGPIVGFVIIGLLNRPDWPALVFLYDQSIFAPLMAMTARALPAATLIVWHALRSVPTSMLDAAAVDGAGSMAQLWRIALPCRKSAVAAALIVSMAISLGDLATSILVVPPGVTTLSIRIFGLLHYGVEDRVAGIALALVAVFALATVGTYWLLRYRHPPERISS